MSSLGSVRTRGPWKAVTAGSWSAGNAVTAGDLGGSQILPTDPDRNPVEPFEARR